MTNKELEELYAELEKVKSSNDEYLPEYGYSTKDEIVQLIEEDIKELEEEMKDLRKQVSTLMNYMCVNLTCQLRKRNINLFNNQDGIDSRQEVEEAKLYNKQPDN